MSSQFGRNAMHRFNVFTVDFEQELSPIFSQLENIIYNNNLSIDRTPAQSQ